MAYLERFLDAGGMAIVGVVVGSSLTYLFAFLTRRSQEKRENNTRWYHARFEAYTAMYNAVTVGVGRASIQSTFESADVYITEITDALARIRFVSSDGVVLFANKLFTVATREMQKARKDRGQFDGDAVYAALADFQAAARKDLGHP
jgi:hypothetical protein